MRLKNFSLNYGTQIFKAFGDEARVRIIHLLFKNDELAVSDLEAILDYTQTKTSRHIGYLKNSGLVNATKKDQWVFYSIKDEVYDMVSQIFDFLNKDLQLQRDQEVYNTMNSNRELAINKLAAKDYRK
ncbi:metalloregulator ArsR/SmtB family transcription factor [Marinoscillum sp. 108]|jgi:ArsR family transcriptional regulator|uniref:ArsR/SmtB family transcription factor n=1 Tax=Marinoscillum luteum TaxID=861051 RepID=A0ABW7N620_9BACT|nr:metalloregulator ArsR/SmtB family transcription factor [Marinoscillum sp. 108]VXD21043.1 Regulatory ArsR family protein [Marinoscillum sp. 108]